MSRRVALLALVAAVLAAWLPGLEASFQFDDFTVIVADARVQSLTAWAGSMPAIRPLLRLSYALNHEFGDGAAGFRIVNILLHAASACLVLLLLESLGRRCGVPVEQARRAALPTTLLWALHPVQTEAVTYISGRSSALAGLLVLASLCVWVRSFDGSARHGRGALAFGLAVAALCTKESAIMLPLALWLWAELPGDVDAGVRRRQRRSALRYALGFAVVALAFAVCTPYFDIAIASLGRRGPWATLLTATTALPWLLGQVLAPWQLSVDPDLAAVTQASAARLLVLALFVATGVGAAAGLRRWPVAAFGILWFSLWLLPTHLLLPREDLANDRQLYLALLGPVWILGSWLGRVPPDAVAAPRRAGAFAVAMLAVALGVLTVARNRVYETEVRFWEAAAVAAPGKARVQNNLGYAYAMACRDDDARRAFERALERDPLEIRARANLKLLNRGTLIGPAQRRCAGGAGVE